MDKDMDFEDALHLAQSSTNVIRSRKNLLYTFGATRLPYICLSPADSDEVYIREGEVTADKPRISFPGQGFKFEGFDEGKESEEGDSITVLLARRISMPPASYINKAGSERRERGPMEEAVERAINRLDRQNDLRTAVISSADQVWGLAVLLYVGSQVIRSTPSNVQEHLERLRLNGEDFG